ncbi:hypothetical protein H2203_001369 [Taxawa tesnikishii (nom. ined.)]|nr:hypothetical protein H2203_001369 [Dothideales sp. JES 119]
MPIKSTEQLKNPQEYQKIFHWAETQQDGQVPTFATRKNDPYQYQAGFNNHFESEAIPGTIPQGQNSPRNVRFGLYAEQMTASAFVAPRHKNKKAWLYRSRPAVAHQGFTNLPDNENTESNFLPMNPRVHVSPTQLAWLPFDVPEKEHDFVDGLCTIAGSGDPTLREGIATHLFTANKSMEKRAFVNSDGDFLIVPQQGALDIQTEFGMMYVQPGEICVIQRGQRFKVNIEGPTRGYILEIWGSNYELPELGPLGANGLANARDFLSPVAHYEVTKDDPWKIVYKLGGKFFESKQNHCPFDVIAWHGNYVPYKYDLTKFVNVGSISVDHIDPSIFCVLTAPSRDPTAPLADFLIFSPLMGLIYGEYAGRSDEFQPGGVSFECGMVPHGVAYEEFKAASAQPPPEMRISEGAVAFMFESSRPFTITDWAMKSDKIHEHDPKMWDDLVDNFSNHKEEVDEILKKAGKLNINGH